MAKQEFKVRVIRGDHGDQVLVASPTVTPGKRRREKGWLTVSELLAVVEEAAAENRMVWTVNGEVRTKVTTISPDIFERGEVVIGQMRSHTVGG